MAKKSRAFDKHQQQRHEVESFRPAPRGRADRFDMSMASAFIVATPILIYDAMHLLNINGTIYRKYSRPGSPKFNGRQKQAIALCQYIEQRGDVCALSRGPGGEAVIEIMDDEDKARYIDALCIVNDLAYQPEGEFFHEEEEQRQDDGADYVTEHARAIDDSGDGLTDPVAEEKELVEEQASE